jgi:two-component system, OmpR family, phosphate regulon response regulator PhoB
LPQTVCRGGKALAISLDEDGVASMSPPTSVLVVDDEPIVREVLSRYLRHSGYEVGSAADGFDALAAFDSGKPDLVLLDLMLPGIDGLEVFRRIRSRSDTPVIMLTARGEEANRIAGLEMGADDYVVKPFSPREVIARVRAVLRRGGEKQPEGTDRTLSFDDLEIVSRTRDVMSHGERVELTPKEFDLLYLMAASPRKVFSRTELLDELWDLAFEGDPSTVTVHIRRLREKIEVEPSKPRHLVTVWGVGYRFEP